MLRVSELTTDFNASETIPIGFHDIMRALPPDLKMTRTAAEQYFKLLSDDQVSPMICYIGVVRYKLYVFL